MTDRINQPDEPEESHRECSGGCCRRCSKEPPRGKLTAWNYLADVPGGMADSEFVEVQFKNTRKGFYRRPADLHLEIGDWVAVEAAPGHDIGMVTMTGVLVPLRMRKANVKSDSEIKRVFRIARQTDLDKFEEAKARENDVMIRARKIADSLQLNMKIGDVEFQGDGNKAIFYYIADERVDFRQLIKVLAETFKVRIEMKQIGARQEAGRIGGIGPCGRPLCCASWMTNFVSVATSAARFQDISLNPQKLAGQCAKLKCCLNFEVDAYVEASKQLPERNVRLETEDGTYYHFKTDIFKREITYSTEKNQAVNLVTIDARRAFEIIEMNRNGEKPAHLARDGEEEPKGKQYNDILDQDNLNRFDNKKRKKKKSKPRDDSSRQPKDSKEPKETRESRDKKESKEQREPKEPREPRQPKAPRESQNQGEPRTRREGGEPAEQGEPKDQKEQRNRNRGNRNRGNRPRGNNADAPKESNQGPKAGEND